MSGGNSSVFCAAVVVLLSTGRFSLSIVRSTCRNRLVACFSTVAIAPAIDIYPRPHGVVVTLCRFGVGDGEEWLA